VGRLTDLDTGAAFDARFASGRLERIRGLIGGPRGVLVIPSRGQVHTFGMKYPIDVIFCDRSWTVVRTFRGLQPRRVTRYVRRVRFIIEAPEGVLDGIEAGSRLSYVSNDER
jgi:uncharacterized protein